MVLALAVGTLAACANGRYEAPPSTGAYYDVAKSVVRLPAALSMQYASARSWMKPNATKSDLLYVSSEMTWGINVFSYPQGKREGLLTGIKDPGGLCSDPKGDIFVPQQQGGSILEYAHGGMTPIATLSDPNEQPLSCSVDSATGTLAVTNVTNLRAGSGSVSLYAHASGSPNIVYPSGIRLAYQCGYDDKGNLFVDGYTNFPSLDGVFAFGELPKGKSKFVNIVLNKQIGTPGLVQWDGNSVAVGDASNGAIYLTNGRPGKIESTIQLSGTDYDFQPWIQGSTIVVPSFYSIRAGFVHYPAGGKAYKAVKVGSPYGATLSIVTK